MIRVRSHKDIQVFVSNEMLHSLLSNKRSYIDLFI